ncbi:hypothetical protein [Haladaptatus sp. CMAA 1911]|uniref:hypothetical protein n=1 Tax=unclassified Haladaptatus TaxID=2622732 RepID=UPI0037544E0C
MSEESDEEASSSSEEEESRIPRIRQLGPQFLTNADPDESSDAKSDSDSKNKED